MKRNIKLSKKLIFFIILLFFSIISSSVFAAQDVIEINNANDLKVLLKKGNLENKKIIINSDITIESKDIPDIGNNVNLINSTVIGQGSKRPTITINSTEQDIQPLFGKIYGDNSESKIKDEKQEYPVLQNFNIVCNGDVIGAPVCAELDSKVREDYKESSHLGYAKDMDITVKGNIIPYKYYPSAHRASGFVVDFTEFDFYNININVDGNIGGDISQISDCKNILCAGLFAENGAKTFTRLENINIKAKDIIAKTANPLGVSYAAGCAVTGSTNQKIYGKNINVDVGNIISSNSMCNPNKLTAYAAVGFLDNFQKFAPTLTNMSIGVTIAPWNVISRDETLGASRFSFDNYVSNQVQYIPYADNKFQSEKSNIISLNAHSKTLRNPLPTDNQIIDPFTLKLSEIVNDSTIKIKPQVINSSFKAKNISISTGAKCGAVFYGIGNLMDVKDNNIEFNDLNINSNMPNVAGIVGIAEEANNNNLKMNNLNVSSIDGTGAKSGSYINLLGHIGGKASKNNIRANNTDININNEGYLYINTGAYKASEMKDSIIHINSLNAKTSGSSSFGGILGSRKAGDYKDEADISNNRLIFDGPINIESKKDNMFAGIGDTIQSKNTGNIKNNSLLFKDINIKGEETTRISGLVTYASGISKIENNSVQVLGDINSQKVKEQNIISGLAMNIMGDCVINDNTLLLMGSITNLGANAANSSLTNLILSGANANILGPMILKNAVYVDGNINTEPSGFHYISGNLYGDNKYIVQNNSILLKNIPEKLKDSKLSETGTVSNNAFVHVDKNNRISYKIKDNGNLNTIESNKIDTLKIAYRPFQDALWTKGASYHEVTTAESAFPYLIDKGKAGGNIDFISVDKDELLQGKDASSLYLKNYYNRHLAVKKDNLIYDILGIPSAEERKLTYRIEYDLNSGTLIDPQKPIEDNDMYLLGQDAVVKSGNNAQKEGYIFLGWSLNKGAKTADYKESDIIKITGNITLYAVWQEKEKEKEKEKFIGGGIHLVPEKEIKIHLAYIFGYPDKSIRPEGNITRAEAAALAIRLSETPTGQDKAIFKDTKKDAWYNKYVNKAKDIDMLLADGENIRPNDNITRGEFAKLISHLDKNNYKDLPFTDTKGHKFEKEIAQAYANSRIAGYPDNTFKPDKEITRAEAVIILNSLFVRVPDKEYIDNHENDIKHFNDLKKSYWAYYQIVEAANTHKYERKENNIDEIWHSILNDIFNYQ
ncbi:MAG: S-layer homology domain-containing protein [Peptoniphilus lacrimalis]